jgi:hypothetical protein
MPATPWLAGLLLFHLFLRGFSLQSSNDEVAAQLKAAGATLHTGVHVHTGEGDRVLRATADLSEGEIIAVIPEHALLYEHRVSSDPLIKHLMENARYVYKPSQAAVALHPPEAAQQAGLTRCQCCVPQARDCTGRRGPANDSVAADIR